MSHWCGSRANHRISVFLLKTFYNQNFSEFAIELGGEAASWARSQSVANSQWLSGFALAYKACAVSVVDSSRETLKIPNRLPIQSLNFRRLPMQSIDASLSLQSAVQMIGQRLLRRRLYFRFSALKFKVSEWVSLRNSAKLNCHKILNFWISIFLASQITADHSGLKWNRTQANFRRKAACDRNL